ncbi:hypothetical protein HPB48_023069 [Haemaphysalis longicornis]|uniref:Uncharacterized protein n=1 Tax=Haemaphysalis longicornis TaxID=44386 RepID=A0A9J6H5U7_HAELO|nr:hypothetical protein HPB48_023069 [Haemaphysalis longicornis]
MRRKPSVAAADGLTTRTRTDRRQQHDSKRRRRESEDAGEATLRKAASFQADWCSRDPEDGAEGDGLWERATTRAKRKAALQRSGTSAKSARAAERTELGTFVLSIRPKERCSITSLNPQEVRRAICALSHNQQLAKHQLLRRFNKESNTLTVHTCDEKQASAVLRLSALDTPSNPSFPVTVHQVPSDGMSRGVIYDCTPGETSETLVEALDSESVQVLQARPMGKKGAVLITFASRHPPRYVKYWDFLKRVSPYESQSVACFRCHGPGPKQDVCPKEKAVRSHSRRLFNKKVKVATQERQSRSKSRRRKVFAPSASRETDTLNGTITSQKPQRGRSQHAPKSKFSEPRDNQSLPQTDALPYAAVGSGVQISASKPGSSGFSSRCKEEIESELKQLDNETEVSTRDFENTLARLEKQLSEIQRSIDVTRTRFQEQLNARHEQKLVLQHRLKEWKEERARIVKAKSRQSPSPNRALVAAPRDAHQKQKSAGKSTTAITTAQKTTLQEQQPQQALPLAYEAPPWVTQFLQETRAQSMRLQAQAQTQAIQTNQAMQKWTDMHQSQQEEIKQLREILQKQQAQVTAVLLQHGQPAHHKPE